MCPGACKMPLGSLGPRPGMQSSPHPMGPWVQRAPLGSHGNPPGIPWEPPLGSHGNPPGIPWAPPWGPMGNPPWRREIEKPTNPNSDFFEKIHDPPLKKSILYDLPNTLYPSFILIFQGLHARIGFTPLKDGSGATFTKIEKPTIPNSDFFEKNRDPPTQKKCFI